MVKETQEVSLLENSDFTLEDILKLSSMEGAEYLTDSSVRSGWIKKVSVIESADLAEWSESGDLVLTTGYAFFRSPDDSGTQLIALKEKGVVGLCIRVTPRHPSPDPDLIREANRIHFPILQLPVTAVFANIVQESMENILNRKIRLFQDIHTTTEILLSAMWDADTPEKGLQVVEKAFHNPVMIFDDENDLILTEETQKILTDSIQEQLIRQVYTRGTTAYLEVTENGKERKIPLYFFDADVADGTVMILMEYYSSLSDRDWIVLRQIGHSLILEMKNALIIKKIRRKYKNQFVEDLLGGKLGNDPIKIGISAQTDGYFLNPDHKYRVIAINLQAQLEGGSFTQNEGSIIRQIILRLDPNMLFAVDRGKLILIQDADDGLIDKRQMLQDLAKKVSYIMNKGSMTFCSSEPQPLEKMNLAYRQAVRISEIAEKNGITDEILTVRNMDADYLLSMLPEEEALLYCSRILGPITEYDRKHNGCLLETLKVYLDENGNKQAAAESLHTHYNTIGYRLSKIEEQLGISLNDAVVQFRLRIAFRLQGLFS